MPRKGMRGQGDGPASDLGSRDSTFETDTGAPGDPDMSLRLWARSWLIFRTSGVPRKGFGGVDAVSHLGSGGSRSGKKVRVGPSRSVKVGIPADPVFGNFATRSFVRAHMYTTGNGRLGPSHVGDKTVG